MIHLSVFDFIFQSTKFISLQTILMPLDHLDFWTIQVELCFHFHMCFCYDEFVHTNDHILKPMSIHFISGPLHQYQPCLAISLYISSRL